MDDADTIAGMYYGDAPDLQQKQQAMAAALRRNQRDQSFSDIGQLFGAINPGLANYAETESKAAGARQAQLEAAPAKGVDLQEGLMKLAQAGRRNTALQDANSFSSQTRSRLAGRFGIQVPDGTTGADIDDKELELGEKATEAEENRKMRILLAQLQGTNREHTFGEKQQQFNQKREDTLAKQATDILNRFNVRGGLKGYSDTIARVNQIKGQVLDPATGHLKDQLDPRQMAELAITLQQAVANGHASEGEVEMLLPKTAWGSAARAQEYFTGHPADTGQRAIAEKMLHSAENAAKVAHDATMQSYRENMSGPIGGLLSIGSDSASKRARALLKAHGINPEAIDESGDVRPDVPFELPTSGGAGATSDGMVSVISPEGKRGRIPAANLQAAQARGFKVVGQ